LAYWHTLCFSPGERAKERDMNVYGWIRRLSVAAMLVLPAMAFADSIGPNCGTCDGGIYTLTWSGTPLSTTATTETDRITFTLNTAGVVPFLTALGGTTAPFYLQAAAIKVSTSVVSVSLFSAPHPLEPRLGPSFQVASTIRGAQVPAMASTAPTGSPSLPRVPRSAGS
jgi:hypothetical protein